MKLYKPEYSTIFLLGGVMLFFVIIALTSIVKSSSFDGSMLIAVIVFSFIFALIELIVFVHAIEFHPEEMKIHTGLGYLLGLSPRCLRYDQISAITENISVKRKFSNLKIHTKNKQYMIFICGVQNYEEVKSELIVRKPAEVEIT